MKYVAKFEFGSEPIDDDARQEWVESIRAALPEDATFDVTVAPLILDLQDVTEQHAGNRIEVYVGAQKGTVRGTLEHVFVTGQTGNLGRTLVIDSKAYEVPAYSLVTLGEW